MVSILQLAFLSDRLKIRDMPEADELTEELQNFRYKAPSNVTIDMEAWRETPGDDLVFAMMMPVWFGEKKLQTIFHPPHCRGHRSRPGNPLSMNCSSCEGAHEPAASRSILLGAR